MKRARGFLNGKGARIPKRCSLCWQAGHNRATCPVMLASDRRRQQAKAATP